MSIVHIFPGQGAQFQGMGKEIYNSSAKAREMMESANEILGFRITDIMFDGSTQELKATKVTQPAIFLHSVALALCDTSLSAPDMVAGHSLGEFSALVDAGVLGFEDALRLVAARAQAMQECCERCEGTMAAVIGLSEDEVAVVCAKAGGLVVPANLNSDSQTVISGQKEAVLEAERLLKEAGARRVLQLEVSGAFHSPLMEPAREKLALAINGTRFNEARCPIYQNATACPETDPDSIRRNLLAQLTSPVLWTRSVRNMLEQGADSFIEIGPGTALQGLVSRIAAARGLEVQIEGIQ